MSESGRYSGGTKVCPHYPNIPHDATRSNIPTNYTSFSTIDNSPRPTPYTPNCEYSPHKRTRITLSRDLGLTRRQIAFNEAYNPASISKVVKRYRYQQSGKSLQQSSRPRVIDEHYHRRLLRYIAIDPFISSTELKENTDLGCHPRTIRRHLIREGIQHSKALRRPKLSEETTAKRLVFARLHVRRPLS